MWWNLGFLKASWRKLMWWWWWWKKQCQWMWIMVVVLVCGGTGLAMCSYWQVPLLPYTYQGAEDPFQPSHSHNGQDSGYTETQRHKSDSVRKGSVQSHPEQMNDYEPHNKYHGNYATMQHELNRHMNEVSYEHLVQSHSGNHQTYKNILAKSPPSANLTNGIKKEGHRQNQTFMTDMENKIVSKMDENKKQNNGPPRVILLLTRWRSGSTFMGELLAKAVPNTFYSYEPLHPWKIKVLEEDDNSTRAAQVLLKDLFQCHLDPHPQQVAYMARRFFYYRWNTHLMSQCTMLSRIKEQQKSRKQQQGPEHERPQGRQERTQQMQEPQHHVVDSKNKIEMGGKRLDQSEDRQQKQEPSLDGKGNNRPSCDNTSFVSDVCRHSSLHVAKVLRLSLRWVVQLIEDKNLPLQVVYLIRDPRAVLRSRSSLPWCRPADCSDPYTVCSSLQRDLLLLPHLLHRFPNRIKMILYEEFVQNLPGSLHDLFAFLHLPIAPYHLRFLKESTNVSPDKKQNPYSTNRNSKYEALMWRIKTPYKQAAKYQKSCKGVLTSLGLRQFTSLRDYHNLTLPALLPCARRLHC